MRGKNNFELHRNTNLSETASEIKRYAKNNFRINALFFLLWALSFIFNLLKSKFQGTTKTESWKEMHLILKKAEVKQVVFFKKIFLFNRQLKPSINSQNVAALLKILCEIIPTFVLVSCFPGGNKREQEGDANSHKETVVAGPAAHLLWWGSWGAPVLVCWQDLEKMNLPGAPSLRCAQMEASWANGRKSKPLVRKQL